MKTEFLDHLIAELDQNHKDAISNQETATGNKLEVYTQVSRNMSIQRNYENDRTKLVKMRNESVPISKGVQDFLAPKKVESKFDVENGTAKIDTSLETQGKMIGKQI